jgi:hypothetical protein
MLKVPSTSPALWRSVNVFLRSFWYYLHAHLITTSTAGVCYYPQDMGVMTSLNLASNDLCAEGAKIVSEAIKVTKCTPAIILAPFSCPSGFSINCCYLLLSAGFGGPIVPRYLSERYLC